MLRFLEPGMARWLLLLPVLFAFWWLHVRTKRRFREEARISPVLQALSRLRTARRDRAALVVGLLALASLVLALMRPQLYVQLRVPEYERRDLVLLLDRSASMWAEDVKPSRFRRAVQEIKLFLERKPEGIDRVGLIGFAGTSLVLSHLTRDMNALFFYLDWAVDDREPHFGTDIGKALASARELIKKDDKKTRKILLVISDGDDKGEELQAQLAALRGEGVRVHTIGIGSARDVPIPDRAEAAARGLLQDEQGAPLTTRFDEATLRDIAATTGGRYYRSRRGDELLTAMREIAGQERRLVGYKAAPEFRDVHRWALLAAAAATLGVLIL